MTFEIFSRMPYKIYPYNGNVHDGSFVGTYATSETRSLPVDPKREEEGWSIPGKVRRQAGRGSTVERTSSADSRDDPAECRDANGRAFRSGSGRLCRSGLLDADVSTSLMFPRRGRFFGIYSFAIVSTKSRRWMAWFSSL